MSAVAGRVLLLFMGDYDSATTYKPMDVVLYGVNSYVCLLESTGNVPTNTTYWQTLAKGISNVSPEALGIGYGISQNTGASKTATLADYTLTINGIVAVTFADDVPANATLNINSQGAKPIYYRGSALVANVIRGGDTVTFAYDGTHYDILCIDGGAGHEIENSAGTKLLQRDVLQFNNGLEATDDSTNQKTKVSLKTDYISLADWNAMSSAEQETYKQEHYRFGIELPDTEGVINAEYMTKLWENPNTSQAFASQNITLDDNHYDYYLVLAYANNSINRTVATIFKAKDGCNIININGRSGGVESYNRVITYTGSNSIYTISDGVYAIGSTANSTNNTVCIPYQILGLKKNIQFKVNAIASELSTRADHCFLSDDVTTVEECVADSGWQTLNANVRYRKIGSVVYVEIVTYSSSGWYTLGTLPVGFRPAKDLINTNYYDANNSSMVRIKPDGTVQNYSSASSLNYIMSYPID